MRILENYRSRHHGSFAVFVIVVVMIISSAVIVYDNSAPHSSSTRGNFPISAPNQTGFSFGQEVQFSSNETYAGYVEYTLILQNNSLVKGNFVGNGSKIGPTSVAYDPLNKDIYLADSITNNITAISTQTNRIIKNITGLQKPISLSVDASNNYLYVANLLSNDVSVINASSNKFVTNITVGSKPAGIAYDPINGFEYVTDYGTGNITVIDTATNNITGCIEVGPYPSAIFYDPVNGFVYVGHSPPQIYAGPSKAGNAFLDPAGTNFSSGDLIVIDTYSNSVVSTIQVGSEISAISGSSSTNSIYIANSQTHNITAVDSSTNSIVSNLTLSAAPYGLEFDPENGYMYVTNYNLIVGILITNNTNVYGSGNVSVLNLTTNKVVSNLQTGLGPFGIALDPFNGDLYASNVASGTLSTISTQRVYSVEFTESGLYLASGNDWYINITSDTGSNFTSGKIVSQTYSFNLPNGSYSYTIGYAIVHPVSGYSMYSGSSITISGSSTAEKVTFTPLYSLTFKEEGLPHSASTWNVTLNGAVKSSSLSSITFLEPNGSYSFTIGIYRGYSSSPYSGTVEVRGAGQSVNVTFAQVTYSVTFAEAGLPSSTEWWVNLSSGQSLSSSSNIISFNLPNGTYNFTVAVENKTNRPSPWTGGIAVNGMSIAKSITFSQVVYLLTFSESGLTSGTSWSVTLQNITKESTNGTIIFIEHNGSYLYTVQGISGYKVTSYSGSVVVSGAPVYNSLKWLTVGYPITISQTDITSGTEWSVTLTGNTFNGLSVNSTLNSTGSEVTFNEPNGTYSYVIHIPTGYTAKQLNLKGSVTLAGVGSSLSVNVQKSADYLPHIVIIVVVIAAIAGTFLLLRKRR